MNPNEPFTQLSRYPLKRVIGCGGLGSVMQKPDPRLECSVAPWVNLKSHPKFGIVSIFSVDRLAENHVDGGMPGTVVGTPGRMPPERSVFFQKECRS